MIESNLSSSLCAVKRIFLLPALAFFLSVPVASEPAQSAQYPAPNIVLVVLDAARADHFSSYGYRADTTPRIDAIGRKGVLSLKTFSQATDTFNSIPLILTSRYIPRPLANLDGWLWGLRQATPQDIALRDDDQLIFMPETLAQNGYRTALFTDHYAFSKETPLAHKFHELHHSPAPRSLNDERVVSGAIDWIQKNRQQKFFLYLHVMSPHGDYQEKDTDSEFLSTFDAEEIAAVRKKSGEHFGSAAKGWSAAELRILRGLYDSSLKHADRWIGALYDELEKLRIAENTVFLITSDHGENLGAHGQLTHGNVPWDSVTHVPLIIVYPPRIPPGAKVRGLTESVDIFPTLLDLAGIEVAQDKYLAGQSLVPLISRPDAGKKYILSEGSIRTENHKYIADGNILYDLKKDPEEENNIAQRRPKIAQDLRSLHLRLMGPHLARYNNAKASGIPAEPFYIPIQWLRMKPQASIKNYHALPKPAVLLSEASTAPPWLLGVTQVFSVLRPGTRDLAPGLMRHPTVPSAPAVTLSCPLPDGEYNVSVLLNSFNREIPVLRQLGLKFRFSPTEPYRAPAGEEALKKAYISELGLGNFAYLDLGPATVTQGAFSLELDIPSPAEQPYSLWHIRFNPGTIKEPSVAPSAQEQRQIEEAIRASGYLWE